MSYVQKLKLKPDILKKSVPREKTCTMNTHVPPSKKKTFQKEVKTKNEKRVEQS